MSKNAYSNHPTGEPTEHQSLASGVHPDEWRAGSTCDDCQRAAEMTAEMKRNAGPLYNLAWLRNSNETGVSAMGMVKEMEADARESGRDMRRVGQSQKARAELNERIKNDEV